MTTRLTAAAVSLLVGGTVLTTGTASAEPPQPSAPPVTATDGRPHQVRLVTGDSVLVGADGALSFLPGKGREHIGFDTVALDGDTHVVPTDAMGMFADGTLDRQLLNVSLLVRDGYADTDTLPLIVRTPGDGLGIAAAGERVAALDAEAVEVGPAETAALWESVAEDAPGDRRTGDTRIWLDARTRLLLDQSVPQVGAPQAWAAGYTGEGVTVAVLDGGYDAAHPDLQGRVTAAQDFTETAIADGYGHGTHVASTVAGTGAASDGRYKGVAPGADLLIGKVCDDDGWCRYSDVIEGMQWAADNGAAAANLSLGSGQSDGTDPMSLALNEISAASGTLFVVSSGNDYCGMCVSSPAAADAALAVGSVTKADEMSEFTSRGPRYGDLAIKPDISAPGSSIVAARASGTEMGEPVDAFYTSADGTSMAAPHVTGAVALLKQAHPDWQAPQLKASLMGASHGLDGLSVYDQGAGRLDAGRAVAQPITADVGSLSFGRFLYPQDGVPVTKTVTYTNTSTTDVPLDLALSATNLDDVPAPTGLFTVDTPRVVVPAGGSADVTVTVDPAVNTVTGTFGGVLTATGGDTAVRTPVGAFVESPMYDVTFDITPRGDAESGFLSVALFNLDTGETDWRYSRENDPTFRLPPGRWQFLSELSEQVGEEESPTWTAIFTHETTVGAGSTSLTLDAADATPLDIDIDRDEAVLDQISVSMTSWSGEERAEAGFVYGRGNTVYIGPSAPLSTQFHLIVNADLVSPDGAAAPYLYMLSFHETGTLPADPAYVVGPADLSVEPARYHSQGPAGSEIGHSEFAAWEGARPLARAGSGGWIGAPTPFSRTEYYSKAPGLSWDGDGYIMSADHFNVLEYIQRLDTARGSKSTVHWNGAPLTVGLTGHFRDDGSDEDELRGVQRDGDRLSVEVALRTGPNPDIVNTLNRRAGTDRTELLTDGVVIASANYPCGGIHPELVPEVKTYTLRCTSARDQAWTDLATRTSVEFTFTSGRTEEPTWLPLNAVRLSSPTVVDGTAPAGQWQAVHLNAYRQPGSEDSGTRRLTFEVSYDDGVTWKKVTVNRFGDDAIALLKPPADADYVSVRLTAADNAGNSVKTTTIRSYGLS
ncbi:S8 family peptidase [Phytomonospora endophytica]|uniref:Subtilisin family serine protease n=1 Tax=Phytomonospora endophytica TaxID=714109 RepID=A0A841FRK4_9ACTN|nr:S8 family serine peptidase [Phytomonospora endophytica]MBB6039921.1 subtilisin family serine protease [Phytomonospora endophytica]GIG71009.1 serine protease [Phytomonospora endophytica]